MSHRPAPHCSRRVRRIGHCVGHCIGRLARCWAALSLAALSAATAMGCAPEITISDPESSDEPTTTVTPLTNAPAFTAPGVTIDGVTINQAVSRPLVWKRQGVDSEVPVIAGRDALMRIHYSVSDESEEALSVQLRIADHGVLSQELQLAGSSEEAKLSSTVNLHIPGEMIGDSFHYRVDITETDEDERSGPADHPAARYPAAQEQWALQETTRTRLKVVAVPVQYLTGSSSGGALPAISDARLQRIAQDVQRMYPLAHIEMSWRQQPLEWSGPVSADGSGWPELLTALASLRESDDADDSTYYYGLVNPEENFLDYCGKSCVAGLGFQVGEHDHWARAAVGVGFDDDNTADVFAHELGHNHGLDHAPCGVIGTSDFPHADGSIGTFGYDAGTDELLAPSEYADLMSYCDPAWISDYSFTLIQQRMTAIDPVPTKATRVSTASAPRPHHTAQPYARLLVRPDGSASWLAGTSPIAASPSPQLAPNAALTRDEEHDSNSDKRPSVAARFYRFDHLDGGVAVLPADALPRTPGRLILRLGERTMQLHVR